MGRGLVATEAPVSTGVDLLDGDWQLTLLAQPPIFAVEVERSRAWTDQSWRWTRLGLWDNSEWSAAVMDTQGSFLRSFERFPVDPETYWR